jgi:hypothetical protein
MRAVVQIVLSKGEGTLQVSQLMNIGNWKIKVKRGGGTGFR